MGKSKNNIANRGQGAAAKFYDGKEIKPVKYVGTHVGHGKYMAVMFDNGNMAEDENGKPIMWDAI
jgi:hypothetical protein